MKKQAAVVSKTPQTPQTSQVKPVRGRPRKKVVEATTCIPHLSLFPQNASTSIPIHIVDQGKKFEDLGKAMQNENTTIGEMRRLVSDAGFVLELNLVGNT